MGLFSLKNIFGGNEAKKYNTMTGQQTNALNQTTNNILGMRQNAYSNAPELNGTALDSLRDLNANTQQQFDMAAHTNRLHSSAMNAVNAGIMNDAQARKNQFLLGQQGLGINAENDMYNRQGIIAGLNSQPRFENVMQNKPGMMGYISQSLAGAAGIASAAKGTK